MGSNPIIGTFENAILLGKLVRICDFFDCEQSRRKTHYPRTKSAKSNRTVSEIYGNIGLSLSLQARPPPQLLRLTEPDGNVCAWFSLKTNRLKLHGRNLLRSARWPLGFSSEQLLVKSTPKMTRARSTRLSSNNSANIGFEQQFWLAADQLRN